jgi:hypothetical protein
MWLGAVMVTCGCSGLAFAAAACLEVTALCLVLLC